MCVQTHVFYDEKRCSVLLILGGLHSCRLLRHYCVAKHWNVFRGVGSFILRLL